MSSWSTSLTWKRGTESPCDRTRLLLGELRIGDLRVYYDILKDPEKRVLVWAVGIKKGNSVWIGGEEVQL